MVEGVERSGEQCVGSAEGGGGECIVSEVGYVAVDGRSGARESAVAVASILSSPVRDIEKLSAARPPAILMHILIVQKSIKSSSNMIE